MHGLQTGWGALNHCRLPQRCSAVPLWICMYPDRYWVSLVMNWEHARGSSIFLSCCSAAADHVVVCCWSTTGQNWANTKHNWKLRFLNASKYFLLLLDWVGFPFFCVLTTVTVSEKNPWRSVSSQLCEYFLLVFLCGSPYESQMHKIR